MQPGFHSSFPFISPQQPPWAHPNCGNTLSFLAFNISPWCIGSELPSLTEPQLNVILRFCIILSLICLAFTRIYELQPLWAFKITLKKASLWSDNVSHSAVQCVFQPGIDIRFKFSFFQTSFFFLNTIFFLPDHNGHSSSCQVIWSITSKTSVMPGMKNSRGQRESQSLEIKDLITERKWLIRQKKK